ncbi:type VII secretion protein EssB [Bacillus sp. RHFS10]|uniref:type VII secretion protein EssB n=1 Tax=Bacillus sp. RHFS10 TaxID=2804501 RepID=UPI001928F0EE|nr:type VII secretion protein EssB [Bacillus sp. RHFS10]MBL3648325.1 type VII secretion protein EssB [Bacillus sp. RHFS10]
MSGKQKSYLENQLEAVAEKTDAGYTFTFQRETIKLLDGLEANVIKDVNPFFHKEIDVTDDEVIITIQPPPSYKAFRFMKAKDKKSKWQFAYQLVQAIQQHNLSRLNVIVAPENIVFDKGLTPYFLHYGVKESIPPYEHDEERVWRELKAAAALAVDGAFAFEEYLKFNETLTFSAEAKAILDAASYDDLLELIQTHIDELEAKAKTYIHIPRKKWNIQRYIGLGLIVLLVPALIYSMYALFFAQPKHQAIVDSNRAFLNKQYSEVISTLSKYDAESLPESVQYQLAYSYVEIEKQLLDYQRDNIEKLVTLQSEPQHFLYWIDIGRGDYKEAISIGHKLEYNPYIWLGLYKYKQQLLAEDSNDEATQKELDSVDSELDKVNKANAEQKKESNTESSTTGTTEQQTQTDKEKQQAEEKAAEEKATKEEQAKKEKETEKKDEKKDDK